jgi:hypothetical protein
MHTNVVYPMEETMQQRRPRLLWTLSIIFFLLTAGVLSGITVTTKAGSNQGLDIVTLSSRPDIVSGGARGHKSEFCESSAKSADVHL